MKMAREFFLALDECNCEGIKAAAGLPGMSLDARDPDGRTPLMLAVLGDPYCHAALNELLKMGANPDAQESTGQKWTALHFASRDCNKEAVKALIQAGADVNARNSLGNTPLHYATGSPKFDQEILHWFIEAGASIEIKNNFGVPVSLLIEESGINIAPE